MQQQLSLLDSILDLFCYQSTQHLGLARFARFLANLSLVNASWRQNCASAWHHVACIFWVIALTNIFGTPSLAEFSRLHEVR